MKRIVSQTAALHIAFWQYDPWYRRAWFIWPQAIAILLAVWLLADRGALPVVTWATPADCSNASNPGCAATRQVMLSWVDQVANPTIANQTTVSIDRAALRNSAAADQPKLSAALGAYYRGAWAKAVDVLKSATPTDPNVQYLTALALLIPDTTDQVRDAQTLLRSAVVAGNRQAAAVLGRTLFVGAGSLPKDEAAGRKLIEGAAAAGDTYAMRLAAAGYLSGAFGGTADSVKAVDLLRRAADAGEPVAMAQLAYCIKTGRGGLTRDDPTFLSYLRRSAQAGYTPAQHTLGLLFNLGYTAGEIDDPSEGIKWYERAYQRGYDFGALIGLAYTYRFARALPWFDTKRSFELLQLCASYRSGYCQYWLARAYSDGAGTERDLVKAYAHYRVAQQLGVKQAAAFGLQRLDSNLQPADKTTAIQLAASISPGLKPIPPEIVLQSAEASAAGPSPWASASSSVVTSAPPPPAAPPGPPQIEQISRIAMMDQKLRIAFLTSLNPDCSSLGFVTVRITEPPQHGNVVVDHGAGFTNYAQDNPRVDCNKDQREGTVVFYEPNSGFVGADSITLQFTPPAGRSRNWHYSISIDPGATAGPGRVAGLFQSAKAIEQARVAVAGQMLQLAFLSELNPDCSSIGYATVRVIEAPKHGKLVAEEGTGFSAFPQTNIRFGCNERRTAGVTLAYTPEAGYAGGDSTTVGVINPDGTYRKLHYKIEVK